METYQALDGYLQILLSRPGLEPITVLSVFFLTLARLLPILVLAPFLGSQNVPGTIRMMFGVALTSIFLPQNLMHIHGNIPPDMFFIGLFLKELLVGTVIAFLATLPFLIAQMAGTLIDFQRGASSLQVTDPTTKTQTGAIGILYNYVLIAIFFSLGGPFLFFNGLATSYAIIPVDGVLAQAFFDINTPFWTLAFGLAAHAFALSIQLCAPSLIGILLMDMFLGIANRMAPQVQIVFLGIPIKSWVGIALLAAAWTLIIQFMGKETITWFRTWITLLENMG